MRLFILILLIVIGELLSSTSVLAQPASNAQARRLYQSGQRAYEAERFAEALEYFEQSYTRSQRTELLYNIGRAAEEAGNRTRAIQAYEQYLATPSTDEAARHAETQSRVLVLRNLEMQAAALPNPTTTESRPHSDSNHVSTRTTTPISVAIENTSAGDTSVANEGWFWPVVLGGGALAIGGAILAVVLLNGSSGVVAGDDGMIHQALTERPVAFRF